MLLLGAVALFEPVNGYQIRRELLSWQVDRWAHTNPGLDLPRTDQPHRRRDTCAATTWSTPVARSRSTS